MAFCANSVSHGDNMEKKRVDGLATLLIVACVAVVTVLIVSDVVSGKREYEKTVLAMDTVVTAKVKGSDAQQAAESICSRIEELESSSYSAYKENSDVYKINNADSSAAEIGASTESCISSAYKVCEASDGAFDITLGTLTKLWGFGNGEEKVPSQSDIDNALQNIGYKKLTLNGHFVTLADGAQLDLGAVGKGAACDEIKLLADEYKLDRAVVSVGGSILLYGDGEFTVGVRDPFGETEDCVGTLTLEACCVSTSGNYERYFTENGVRYHHILDPRTGYPADSGLASVTVVSESGIYSDALSTACFVIGYEKSLELLDEFNAEAVFVTEDGEINVTEGLRGSFEAGSGA